MIKVRFHLARGKNYMKWQIKDGIKTEYYEPDLFNLIMNNCQLHNKPNIAKKIFNGENKTVCAWISCQSVNIVDRKEISSQKESISYNPRIAPHWRCDNGNNIDNKIFKTIVSVGHKLFVV